MLIQTQFEYVPFRRIRTKRLGLIQIKVLCCRLEPRARPIAPITIIRQKRLKFELTRNIDILGLSLWKIIVNKLKLA